MAKSTVWILVFYHQLLVLVLGWLAPPQNATLTSENFKYIFKWEPGAGSPPDTIYVVEIWRLNRDKMFKPVKECTNITVRTCDLSSKFETTTDLYWARVKSIISASESNWTESKELQPFRDSSIGPPIVAVIGKEWSLKVTLTTPKISLKERNSSSLEIWKNTCGCLCYIVNLFNKNKRMESRYLEATNLGIAVTVFEDLQPVSLYCVVAKFDCLAGHSIMSTKYCYSTPTQSADIQWISILVGLLFMIFIVTVFVALLIKLGACLEMGFDDSEPPKTLAILHQDIHIDWQSKELDENSQGDHISFISHDDFTDVCHNDDQSTIPAVKVKLQPPPLSYHFNTDVSVCYESNGLNNIYNASEDYSESKELGASTYQDIKSLPLYIKASSDEERCTSLYQQCVNSQITEQPKNTDWTPSALVPETWKNDFGAFCQSEANTAETKEDFLERLKNQFFDVPLSSVKLFLNDDSEGGKFETAPCGVKTLLSNSDTFYSQFPGSFAIVGDKIANTRQGYEPQPVKLP
eukprot:gi/632935410/ref/XP_007890021.1/ PREDICTED: uncharacterized protein LOC103177591 isoform X1 [Callorhinchus milii]